MNVPYTTLSTSPSDYANADGTLSHALNLIHEDGAMRPVLPAQEMFQLKETERVIYLHQHTLYQHFIVYDSARRSLSYKYKTDTEFSIDLHVLRGGGTLHQVTSIGHTLILLTSEGMQYLLWKPAESKYVYLGSKIPELPISFGLQGTMEKTEHFGVEVEGGELGTINIDNFAEPAKKDITAGVLAQVNKFIAEQSIEKGRFLFPFFVRYAYRLYDGTLTHHSAPILMTTCTDSTIQAYVHGHPDIKSRRWTFFLTALFHELDYIAHGYAFEQLQDWKDIVTSVDIFISAPIYTYDQNGECKRFTKEFTKGVSVCKYKYRNNPMKLNLDGYQKHHIINMYGMDFGDMNEQGVFQQPAFKVELPYKSEEKIKEDIRQTSLFYLLRSVKLEDLPVDRTTMRPTAEVIPNPSERTIIAINKEFLSSLQTREQMTQDYDSHDELLPSIAFTYNGRLNLSGLRKRLFGGFSAYGSLQHCDGYYDNAGTHIWHYIGITYYIRENGQEFVSRSDHSGKTGINALPTFLYHPNPNAYKAIITVTQYAKSTHYEVKLEPHSLLNGAFWFGEWKDPQEIKLDIQHPITAPDEKRIVSIPNKIYTSAVQNPYYFPVSGINTIGTGEVIGISSTTKALSEGQFGQFPLYAFTTEGIWALEVSNTGTYSARQPISRDVCTNPQSITQTDGAVLFSTDRGVMLLQGSSVVCISDMLDDTPFPIHSLPHIAEVGGKAGFTLEDLTLAPMKEYIKEGGMAYDYAGSRIIVFNPNYTYAYMFSLKSQAWGLMQASLHSTINVYPDIYANTTNHKLVNLSAVADGVSSTPFFLLTRPLRFGMGDALRTVRSVIQRGLFTHGAVGQILYGSKDLKHWFPVWSSADQYLRGFRGTPYKAYRIALVGRLSKDEIIAGMSIEASVRYIDKER